MKLTKTQKKIFLGSTLGVLGTASVVTPITTAFLISRENKWPNFISVTDQKYDVSVKTYRDMKKQLKIRYAEKLDDAFLSPEDIQAKMDELEENIAAMEDVFQDGSVEAYEGGPDAHNYDYVTLTQTLSNFAADLKINDKPCDIKLVRLSNATWDDLDTNYQSLASEFTNEMLASGMKYSEIAQILFNAHSEYLDVKAKIQAENFNDILGGILNGEEKLLEIFKDLNTTVARFCASQKIKDFLRQYKFEYRDPASAASYKYEKYNPSKVTYTSLLKRYIESVKKNEKCILTDDEVNNLFKVTNLNDPNQQFYFDSKKMIPGNYIVVPTVTGVYSDNNKVDLNKTDDLSILDSSRKSNEFSIDIAWGVKSGTYQVKHNCINDAKIDDELTAYLSEVGEQSVSTIVEDVKKSQETGESVSQMDLMMSTDPVSTCYSINPGSLILKNHVTKLNDDEDEEPDPYVSLADSYFTQTTEQESLFFSWKPEGNVLEAIWDKYDETIGQDEQTFYVGEQAIVDSGLRYSKFTSGDGGKSTAKYVYPMDDSDWEDFKPIWELKSQQEDRNDGLLEIESLFAKYCVLFGKVTMKNNTDTHIQLYAMYRNSYEKLSGSQILNSDGTPFTIKKKIIGEDKKEKEVNVNVSLSDDDLYYLLTNNVTINDYLADKYNVNGLIIKGYEKVESLINLAYHVRSNISSPEKEPTPGYIDSDTITTFHPEFKLSLKFFDDLNKKYNSALSSYEFYSKIDDFETVVHNYKQLSALKLAMDMIQDGIKMALLLIKAGSGDHNYDEAQNGKTPEIAALQSFLSLVGIAGIIAFAMIGCVIALIAWIGSCFGKFGSWGKAVLKAFISNGICKWIKDDMIGFDAISSQNYSNIYYGLLFTVLIFDIGLLVMEIVANSMVVGQLNELEDNIDDLQDDSNYQNALKKYNEFSETHLDGMGDIKLEGGKTTPRTFNDIFYKFLDANIYNQKEVDEAAKNFANLKYSISTIRAIKSEVELFPTKTGKDLRTAAEAHDCGPDKFKELLKYYTGRSEGLSKKNTDNHSKSFTNFDKGAITYLGYIRDFLTVVLDCFGELSSSYDKNDRIKYDDRGSAWKGMRKTIDDRSPDHVLSDENAKGLKWTAFGLNTISDFAKWLDGCLRDWTFKIDSSLPKPKDYYLQTDSKIRDENEKRS